MVVARSIVTLPHLFSLQFILVIDPYMLLPGLRFATNLITIP